MASERMRILICKFELSSAAFSSAMPGYPGELRSAPDCSQSGFGAHPTDSPPPCFRLVRPERPGQLRSAPDCSQSHFWTHATDFIPPPCFRLVRPEVPWGAQKCPRLQPEPL